MPHVQGHVNTVMAAAATDLLMQLPGVARAASYRTTIETVDDASFIGFSKYGTGVYHLHKATILTDSERRLLALIRKEEKFLRIVIQNAITSAKLAAGDIESIARLITQGRIEEVLQRVGQTAGIRVSEGYASSYVLAGQDTASVLEDALDVVIGFDQVNYRAVNHMRMRRLELIREFTEELRDTTNEVLRSGIERGINPRAQAREFRDSIGLTARQERAAQNYRSLLERTAEGDSAALTRELRDRRFDRTVQRAARTRKPLTQAQVDRMVTRYRERYVKYRSEVIARTESLRSVHAGADEGYRQAIEGGHIQEDEIRRTWVAASDERTRESHMLLNGQVRGINETFQGLYGELKYPGDADAPGIETISCRCVLSTRLIRQGAR